MHVIFIEQLYDEDKRHTEKVGGSEGERFGAMCYQRMRLGTTQGRANAEQDEECSSIRTQIPLSGLSECGGGGGD